MFLNELYGRYCIALGNLFVCGVAQVGTWLDADWVVSTPEEFLASTSARSRGPQARGQWKLGSRSVKNDRFGKQYQLTFVLVRFIYVGPFIVVGNLGHSSCAILIPNQSLVCFPRLLSPLPPTSNDHHTDISEIKPHEDQSLPQKELTVPKDGDDQTCGDEEEPYIPQERVPLHLEGPNDAHRAHHTTHDERSGPEQLPNSQTSGIASHGREGREQIGTAVSESEKRYSRDTFVQPEGLGYRGEIWAEEVGSAYADCREEECEPDDEAGEGPWSDRWFCAEVSLDVRDREEGI